MKFLPSLLLLLLFSCLAAAWVPSVTRQAAVQVRQAGHLYGSASSSSSEQKASQAASSPPHAAGSIVTIDCKLVPTNDFVPEPLIDGVVLSRDDPPQRLSFVLMCGNYLPGLHELVRDMQVGEEVSTTTDAGWGARNPNLVATVTFEQSGVKPSDIQVGTELLLANGARCVVTNVTDKDFCIDANPPLAGATYEANVKLIRVEQGPSMTEYKDAASKGKATSRYDVATFALGCFWGGELEFMRVPGVVGTAVGYTQGSVENPSYKQVCSGTTGHTEAIAVTYDPDVVSYETLVQIAMNRLGENKYLLNQVGNDRGTQYRHGVYYHTDEQMEIAERLIQSFGEDCVTECLPASKFWFAEDYHQQYLLKGGQSARKGDDSTIRCYG